MADSFDPNGSSRGDANAAPTKPVHKTILGQPRAAAVRSAVPTKPPPPVPMRPPSRAPVALTPAQSLDTFRPKPMPNGPRPGQPTAPMASGRPTAGTPAQGPEIANKPTHRRSAGAKPASEPLRNQAAPKLQLGAEDHVQGRQNVRAVHKKQRRLLPLVAGVVVGFGGVAAWVIAGTGDPVELIAPSLVPNSGREKAPTQDLQEGRDTKPKASPTVAEPAQTRSVQTRSVQTRSVQPGRREEKPEAGQASPKRPSRAGARSLSKKVTVPSKRNQASRVRAAKTAAKVIKVVPLRARSQSQGQAQRLSVHDGADASEHGQQGNTRPQPSPSAAQVSPPSIEERNAVQRARDALRVLSIAPVSGSSSVEPAETIVAAPPAPAPPAPAPPVSPAPVRDSADVRPSTVTAPPAP